MSMNKKNAVTQFMYYMWNAWSKEECISIYGPRMGEHFWNKYTYYRPRRNHDYAMCTLYASMSDHYRDMLVNRALQYYEQEDKQEDEQ